MPELQLKLVLEQVREGHARGARRELARLLDIDDDIAGDIVGAAPIVLLAAMAAERALLVRRRLDSVVAAGAVLTLTDSQCDELPQVNWPETPEIVEGVSVATRDLPVHELARFGCPTCGEVFHLVQARGAAPPVADPIPSLASSEQVEAVSRAPLPPAKPLEVRRPATAMAFDVEEALVAAERLVSDDSHLALAQEMEIDEGPLVRALHERRQQRESARLSVPATEDVEQEVEELVAADDLLESETTLQVASMGATTEMLGVGANLRSGLSLDREPSGEEDLAALDIEEALRLLDEATLDPPPSEYEMAPAPIGESQVRSVVHDDEPASPPVVDSVEIDFADLDDFSVLEEVPAIADSSSSSLSHASSGLLAPLEPDEALAILEQARSPLSSNDDLELALEESSDSPALKPLTPKEAKVALAHKPARRGGSRRAAAAGRTSSRRRVVEPHASEPVHGLVLSRIISEAKRQKAADIIVRLTGLSRPEADDLAQRNIIPVLKGVPKTEAEAALEEFRRMRISGRITARRIRD